MNLSDLSFASAVEVGALPDMLTFTPDGAKVVIANEGEPNDDYSIDPEGSVSVISLPEFSLTAISFTDFNAGENRNSELPTDKMVVDGYNASVAQSVEPEYVTISQDGSQAYVALQENNAIAVIDMATLSIERIFGLGFKDYSIPGNELDAGDLGPESIQFVSADDSPNNHPLIIVGNEVSGTTTIYQIDVTLLQAR